MIPYDDRLECRICLTYGHRADRRVELGMYDPLSGRYEPLGVHGPDPRAVDKAVYDLKESIERAGHRLTFSSRSGPR